MPARNRYKMAIDKASPESVEKQSCVPIHVRGEWTWLGLGSVIII